MEDINSFTREKPSEQTLFYAILLPRSFAVVPTAANPTTGPRDRAPSMACRPDRRRNVLSLDCQSAFYGSQGRLLTPRYPYYGHWVVGRNGVLYIETARNDEYRSDEDAFGNLSPVFAHLQHREKSLSLYRYGKKLRSNRLYEVIRENTYAL